MTQTTTDGVVLDRMSDARRCFFLSFLFCSSTEYLSLVPLTVQPVYSLCVVLVDSTRCSCIELYLACLYIAQGFSGWFQD